MPHWWRTRAILAVTKRTAARGVGCKADAPPTSAVPGDARMRMADDELQRCIDHPTLELN